MLDVTLDCSTIPYTIVSLGDTATETPTAPMGAPFATIAGIACLLASLTLVCKRLDAR